MLPTGYKLKSWAGPWSLQSGPDPPAQLHAQPLCHQAPHTHSALLLTPVRIVHMQFPLPGTPFPLLCPLKCAQRAASLGIVQMPSECHPASVFPQHFVPVPDSPPTMTFVFSSINTSKALPHAKVLRRQLEDNTIMVELLL